MDLDSNYFDWQFYINEYGDLREAGIDSYLTAYDHYQKHGKKEGRKCNDGKIIDWSGYINRYKDLKLAGIDNYFKAKKHYLNHGKKENRKVDYINKNVLNFMNKHNLIKLIYNFDYDQRFEFKKNNKYIISPVNLDIYLEKLEVINSIEKKNKILNITYVNSIIDKHFIIFYTFKKDIKISIKDLLVYDKIHYHSTIIGNFLTSHSKNVYYKQFFILGKNKLDISNLGLKLNKELYKDFIFEKNENNNKFNLEISRKYFYYFNVTQEKEFQSLEKKWFNFRKKYNTHFHTKNCLIITKRLHGYGGNQKSAYQLIELLERYFNLSIISHSLTKKTFFSSKDITILNLPNTQILKIRKQSQLIEFINNSKFDLVINNKCNEFMNLLPNINFKCPFYAITHNSMDPFNRLIIHYKEKIDKIFTINRFHKELISSYCKKKKVNLFHNYIKKCNKVANKNYFNFKILYVGRLSKEKNVHLLLESCKKVFKTIPNLKIYIAGDGNINCIKHSNINYLGKISYNQIIKYLSESDYLILPSSTEGMPFSILEAMSLGIPCIYSKINGSTEIIKHNENGFLFELKGFEKCKNNIDNWEVINEVEKYFDINVDCLKNTILKAYSIDIDKWNILSKNCYNTINSNYLKQIVQKKNACNLNLLPKNKKKIFINFKPENVSYGGGNTWCLAFISEIINNNDAEITYEFESDINIFLVIDPFKDKKYKKYSLSEIVSYRNNNNKNGKIVIRVNDCDITRPNCVRSREKEIKKYQPDIDFYIFNSEFIKVYYQKNININNKNHKIIYNGCDQTIFKPKKKKTKNNVFRIVTHHWSDNLNKGYDIYLKLWKFCLNKSNIDFVFIGKNVPEMFKEVKIVGPLHGLELSEELNNCDIYITSSIYDSCPNHVIEAISCGLPILYINKEGGGRNLCELPSKKIGKKFNDFKELIEAIKEIISNYSLYYSNILECQDLFDIKNNMEQYLKIFLQL